MHILRSGLFLICGLIVASSAWIEIYAQDKIHRRAGKTLEGEILEETESYVKIKLRYGEIKVKRTEITKIERGVGGAEEAYLALLDKTDKDDPEAVAELARWCKDHDRIKEARRHWDQVLDLDPDHKDARKARGFVRAKDGKWVRSEDVAKRGKEDKEREKISKRLEGSAEEFEGVPWAEAYEVPSAHYLLTCNVTRPVAERYSKFMESAYAGYLEFFRKIHTPSAEKSDVYIFRNYEEYVTMTGRPGIAGFYAHTAFDGVKARSVTAYHGGFGTTGGT
ncbi:MAG: hypothetical protein O6952_06465, partial [Planctomycetota bacterium]|nr:hypothetical protein [Planctomycetota bacterium]